MDEKCSGADYAAEFLRRVFVSDGTEKDGSADVSVDDSSAFGELCLKPRKRLHMAGYGDLSSADRAEPASVPRRGYRIFQHVLYHSVFRGSRFYSGHPYQRFVNAVCAFFIFVQVRGSGLAELRGLYHQNLLLRFPYLYLCIVGIAYIIMFSIQRYWVEKEKSRLVLEHRIHEEKKKLADMSLHVITSMYSALSAKIPEIDRHCEQTAAYSRRIAEGMGLDETACTNAYYAGLLHEVGAVGLPDEIIQKSSLTEEQYEIYQTYVSRGYRIIRELQIADEVAEAVRYHRGNYDGSGYLEGRSGKNIPVLARILSVADYADRHARWGETAEEISQKLEERKETRFDPECAEQMRAILNPADQQQE